MDEGQDGTLVIQNSDENYNIDIEIFVSSVEVDFSEIGCVGVGGQLDYTISIQDSAGSEIGSDEGSIGCGGETASWGIIFFDNEAELELGEYEITIGFTNNGTPVQANWDYLFAIVYEF